MNIIFKKSKMKQYFKITFILFNEKMKNIFCPVEWNNLVSVEALWGAATRYSSKKIILPVRVESLNPPSITRIPSPSTGVNRDQMESLDFYLHLAIMRWHIPPPGRAVSKKYS